MELSATPYSVGATSRIHSLRTKCHMEQSATPHGGGHLLNPWGPPLESVGLLLLCSFSRKLIILNKLQLVWGMGGSDGCRNDTLLIVGGRNMEITVSGTLGPHYMTVRGTLGLQTGSRCMETTIRSDISSPSTSDNDPRLSYIWMYVSWDRYRDTYLDIWVRRVIIIIDVSYDSRYSYCYVYLLCYDSRSTCRDSSDDSGYWLMSFSL